MYCHACGIQLPDDARFCFKCGMQQGMQTQAPTGNSAWETCEIICEVRQFGVAESFTIFFTSQLKGRFKAQAIGPLGVFLAGETPEIPVQPLGENTEIPQWPRSIQVVNELVVQLMKEGWEPTDGRGPHWYSHRLRRRL